MPFDYTTQLSGANGDAWLADAGDHYTTTGRTVLAGDGDPVGSLSGEAGNFNAEQATDNAYRPVLTQSGTKWYLDYDGSDDWLRAGTAGDWNYGHNGTGDMYIAAAVRYGNTSNPDAAYGICGTYASSSSTVGFYLTYDDRSIASANNATRYAAGKGVAPASLAMVANGTWTPQADHIVEIVKSGTSVSLYVDGVLASSGTLTSPSASNSVSGLYIGAISGSTFNALGRIYGLLVTDSLPDASTRLSIQQDMVARTVDEPALQPNQLYLNHLATANGEAWLADAGDHYQDAARTTAAVSGDPVGSLSGEAGNFNANQATTGERPILTQDGTKWYLDFDGTNDHLEAGTTSSWNYLHNGTGDAYVCLAVRLGATADPGIRCTVLATANQTVKVGYAMVYDDLSASANLHRVAVFDGTGNAEVLLDAAETITGGTDFIWEVIKVGKDYEAFINGVSVGTDSSVTPSAANSGYPLSLGTGQGTTGLINPTTGRIYGAFVTDTVPDASTRLAIREDMSLRTVDNPLGAGAPTNPIFSVPAGLRFIIPQNGRIYF